MGDMIIMMIMIPKEGMAAVCGAPPVGLDFGQLCSGKGLV
jgi:hypothetical protein